VLSEYFDCSDPEQRTAGLVAAVDAIRIGELVVLPTDTVYGIGADAFSAAAVSQLLEAKGRGRDMPTPVLVGSWATLDGLVQSVSTRMRDVVQAFWPGALTVVVEHAPSLAWDLGDARGTVAIRMPSHPLALELLGETGPLAVSSANMTGHPPALDAEQAREQFHESVAVYLDAGPTPSPVASTIVDLTGRVPRLRRAGAVTLEQLREVLPDLEAPGDTVAAPGPRDRGRSPR
jgi:tRNA threonylcarbamoyl adenosine modification protein (Sua5/YciO/YrdC/YwlC family)